MDLQFYGDDFSAFCSDFYVYYAEFVAFCFGFEVGVQVGEFVFFLGKIDKGAEEVCEHGFVSFVAEKEFEDPVVGGG